VLFNSVVLDLVSSVGPISQQVGWE